jgi:myo-inositol-1(or 4)-monophosphatase
LRHKTAPDPDPPWKKTTLKVHLALEFKGENPLRDAVPNTPSFASLLATAHALADRAGAVILPHFRSGLAIDHKGGALFDPVTAADIAAETAIRDAIADAHPAHGIVGEELGASRPEADYCWIIDPIDGTRAFIVGQPLWGTLIGLIRNGTPLLGLMNQPFTGERFWSGETQSYFRHASGMEQTIRTRPCGTFSEALLLSSSPDLFETEEERASFAAIERAVRLRRFGGDCYNYCLLALGQIDLVVEAGLKDFDILPLIPIIERAGGVVSTWEGGDPRKGGRILAAGDPRLHEQAVNLLTR